ncbi:DUF1353 domain-containing protein [Pseudomonas sp. NPDC098747]|uniref:DUF1353 domain-containing protein n=1 Tax=Pseudomonas sp. NPDC098747 TaxID=3364487 RepID=UPI00383B3253
MSRMSRFSAPLRVQYDAEASKALGGDHWRVTQDFRYYIQHHEYPAWVHVPAGYLTDGASVPRLFWSLIPPWGAYGQAAVVHDIVCEYLSVTVDGQPQLVTRSACDQILLEAMTVLEVPTVKRKVISGAVGLYRRLSGVAHPTSTPEKRALEASWAS